MALSVVVLNLFTASDDLMQCKCSDLKSVTIKASVSLCEIHVKYVVPSQYLVSFPFYKDFGFIPQTCVFSSAHLPFYNSPTAFVLLSAKANVDK